MSSEMMIVVMLTLKHRKMHNTISVCNSTDHNGCPDGHTSHAMTTQTGQDVCVVFQLSSIFGGILWYRSRVRLYPLFGVQYFYIRNRYSHWA